MSRITQLISPYIGEIIKQFWWVCSGSIIKFRHLITTASSKLLQMILSPRLNVADYVSFDYISLINSVYT